MESIMQVRRRLPGWLLGTFALVMAILGGVFVGGEVGVRAPGAAASGGEVTASATLGIDAAGVDQSRPPHAVVEPWASGLAPLLGGLPAKSPPPPPGALPAKPPPPPPGALFAKPPPPPPGAQPAKPPPPPP
ncbi:hypothetical protein, partial [Amycolatopsis sp. NPDC003861]